ncbi:MAG TPA: beta-galactosidase, partial [Conexibacter sp.]|nr:beta-galactosidase [Conexibacter sp.]
AVAAALICALLLSGCEARSPSTPTVAQPPVGAPPLTVGIVPNSFGAGDDEAVQAAQEEVRGLGVGWIREEIGWPEVEPRRGEFDWARIDALMERSTRNGLRVLPLLLGTPPWAGPQTLALPDDVDAFAAFAGRVAARYGPDGSFWRARPQLDATFAPQWFELWNEPYYESFARSGVDPARYAALVRAAVTAGRGANPRARWLVAFDLTYERADGERAEWIDPLFAAEPGLAATIDGIALHPYSFFEPSAGPDEAALAFRVARVGTVLAELAAHGVGDDVPVWFTEIGWSSCSLRPECVSEHEQAQRFADLFQRVWSGWDRRVRAVFAYHLRDFSARDEEDVEAHFGLLRTDGSRKQAAGVVEAAARKAR